MTHTVAGSPSIARAGRRAVWTIGDQVVASLQSFGISLAVTHSTDLSGIGAFAVAFTVYQLLLSINRPLNLDPLAVGFSASDRATQRPAAAAATGGAFVLGLLAAVGCAGAGLLFGSPTGPALLALAFSMPAFMLQDAWRSVFFTSGRPALALFNDTLVLVALVPACLIARDVAPHSAAGLVGAWGAATGLGAIVGAFQARVWPALDRAVRWWSDTIHLGVKMLGENVLVVVATGAGSVAIASGAGLTELGRVRTAQVALGFVSSVMIATMTICVAEGTRALAHDDQRRFPQLIRLAGIGSAVLTAAAVAFWMLLPTEVGRDLIGSQWESSRTLVVPCGLFLAALGFSMALSGALRALRRPGTALRIRIFAAPVSVLGAGIGAAFGGAGPAMVGIAAGEWLCVFFTMLAYRSVWRQWQSAPWDVAPLPMSEPSVVGGANG